MIRWTGVVGELRFRFRFRWVMSIACGLAAPRARLARVAHEHSHRVIYTRVLYSYTCSKPPCKPRKDPHASERSQAGS